MPPLRQTLCLITLVTLGLLGPFPLDLPKPKPSRKQNPKLDPKVKQKLLLLLQALWPRPSQKQQDCDLQITIPNPVPLPPCISVAVLWLWLHGIGIASLIVIAWAQLIQFSSAAVSALGVFPPRSLQARSSCLTCVEGASPVSAGCANMLGSQEVQSGFSSSLAAFSKDP